MLTHKVSGIEKLVPAIQSDIEHTQRAALDLAEAVKPLLVAFDPRYPSAECRG